MRLLRLSEVGQNNKHCVFRYSIARPAAVGLVMIGAGCALAMTEITGPTGPAYYLACYLVLVLLICLMLMRRMLLARLRPSNWLAQIANDGVLIQFRSYLNYHLPADDRTVVFVRFSDIRAARFVRERVTIPDEEGYSYQYHRLVELELAADLTPLSQALAGEATKPAPKERAWYGTTSTLYKHYPVRIVCTSFLQIEWTAVPGAVKFLEALRPFIAISPPVAVSEDLANFGNLSRDEQEKRLRELDRRGRTIAAVYMARRLYGYDLAQAQAYVKGLGTQQ